MTEKSKATVAASGNSRKSQPSHAHPSAKRAAGPALANSPEPNTRPKVEPMQWKDVTWRRLYER
jgi:hypothetical protein